MIFFFRSKFFQSTEHEMENEKIGIWVMLKNETFQLKKKMNKIKFMSGNFLVQN